MRNLLTILIAVIGLTMLPVQAHAAGKAKSKSPQQVQKERLVLMPLRLEEEQKLQGAMESALVDGLQNKYTVMWGEEVEKKAKEIFRKENQKHECNEERCMQGIAEAFQSELLATANITKQDGGYFLTFTIQNLYDHVVVFTRSIPCEGCSAFKVIDKLKELGIAAAPVVASSAPVAEAPQIKLTATDPDAELWAEAQKGNTVEDYQAYLDSNSKGKYVAFAKSRLKKLYEAAQATAEQQEQQAWDKVQQDSNNKDVIENYLSHFSGGRHFAAATSKLNAIKEEEAKGIPMLRIPGKNFELSKYETTQKEWSFIMGANPSHFQSCGDNCPVEHVSWNEVQEFIQKLNAKTGRQYRLPTEAEWIYACHGGSKSTYCGSKDIESVAWYANNSDSTTHPTGQKQANEFGLHDMSGNVIEWLNDCYDSTCEKRVLRGGSYGHDNNYASTSSRVGMPPSTRNISIGFRLARTLP